MKQVFDDRIVNVNWDLFDNTFLFKIASDDIHSDEIEVYYMEDLLKPFENTQLRQNIWDKYAMFSNVYSPKDELQVFKDLFNLAISTWKRIHIVWISLSEEIEILEHYYRKLWFMRRDLNCYDVDFSIPLVTASVKIENLIWKGSDYKSQKENIFFIPPPRESWHNRALFKWINRWIIAWIFPFEMTDSNHDFLSELISWEKILPIKLAEVLKYSFEEIWFKFSEKDLKIKY